MAFRRDYSEYVGNFFKKRARNATTTAFEKDGVRIAVHEAVHGTNPILPEFLGQEHSWVNRWLVETTTEAATRQIIMKKFGVRAGGYQEMLNMFNDFVADGVEKVLPKLGQNVGALAKPELDTMLGQASLQLMKSDITYKTGRDYAQKLVDEMVWPERLFQGMDATKRRRLLKSSGRI